MIFRASKWNRYIYEVKIIQIKIEAGFVGWLLDLAFLTDISEGFNRLNVNLQRNGTLLHELFFDLKSFQIKLELFKKHIATKYFSDIFPVDNIALLQN